ncbi:hypothetical protein IWQ55_000075 [Labrenzia sp. EL_208]|uniref:hypothetical protein n=1 Tax=Roseibium album TaxID=311410 RepID=UPI0011A1FFA2|nr:hypothetical protein [Roseibium album]MBG6172898.1 hypothetical protein [Labrenzia sp. EL_132]MBG6226883.1 hypothetical protein [Labrenzia sp. EL_208]
MFQHKTSWKSAALFFPVGLLLTGFVSAVLVDLAMGRDLSGAQLLAQATWKIGLVSVVPYIPIGLLARSITLKALNSMVGSRET